MEYLHTATMLHDDVVDNSSLRRGNPTANSTWGNAPSVLVGDLLYSRSFQLLVRIGNQQVLEIMAEVTGDLAEGEVLQLMHVGDAKLDEATYLRIIRNKTAVLFEATARSSAILAAANAEQLSCIRSLRSQYRHGFSADG